MIKIELKKCACEFMILRINCHCQHVSRSGHIKFSASTQQIQWGERFGGDGTDQYNDCATLIAQSLSYTFQHISVGFTTSTNLSNCPVTSSSAMLITSHGDDGSLQWSRCWQSSNGGDYAQSLAIDSQNEIWIVGTLFGPFMDLTFLGGCDIILIRLSAGGEILSKQNFGTTANDTGYSISLPFNFRNSSHFRDPISNMIYITATTDSTIFNGQNSFGNKDGLVLGVSFINNNTFPINSTLTLNWSNLIGDSGDDKLNGIFVSRSGHVVVIGQGQSIISSAYPLVASLIAENGTLEWNSQQKFQMSSLPPPPSLSSTYLDISIDCSDNLNIVGSNVSTKIAECLLSSLFSS